ncbi:MAG TPA: pantoate--beta-alanine ligase [Saprospiraceae bacterium]|nr:pantoate--beta-alanine ligase [Saprospiraceae bacterium]
MFLYKQSEQINAYLKHVKSEGKTLAFIPTMGALHDGHLSLIKLGKQKADLVICSIFVNPTQFNQKEDFLNYPNTLPDDLEKLEASACDIVFAPSTTEVYAEGEEAYRLNLDMDAWTNSLEGAFRPGHFEGMMQVVARLLEIIPADVLIMGQKDYQQWSIVREMLAKLDLSTQVMRAPIVRENDGLAMSSRNRRIDASLRPEANTLFKALSHAKNRCTYLSGKNTSGVALSPNDIVEECRKLIDKSSLKLEYFEIVDGLTLQPIDNFDAHSTVVALTAGWLGDVRLIDNMILKD